MGRYLLSKKIGILKPDLPRSEETGLGRFRTMVVEHHRIQRVDVSMA